MTASGEEALEVYNTLHIVPSRGDEISKEDFLIAFKNYCRPQKNIVTDLSLNCITEVKTEFGWSEDDMG